MSRVRRSRVRTAKTTIEPNHDRNAAGSDRSPMRVKALMNAS